MRNKRPLWYPCAICQRNTSSPDGMCTSCHRHEEETARWLEGVLTREGGPIDRMVANEREAKS